MRLLLTSALIACGFAGTLLRAQGSIVPSPNHVVVENFKVELRISVSLPGRVGGFGHFFSSEIEFPFVGFEQGHIDYVGARLDLDDTEFDLILTKLCTQVVVAGELALVSGEVCDSGPEGHVAGEVLSLELGEDYQVKSSFSWLPGSRITLALELPAWAPEPLRFANRRLLLIGEATVLVGQPEAGIVELEWKGQVWMEQVFRRGDSNDDGAVDLADAVFTLRSLFSSVGESPGCRDAADANGDGTLEVTDAIYELNHLFLGGPALAVPNVDHRSRTPRDPSTASVS